MMKQVWRHHRQGDGRTALRWLMLLAGVILISLALASCKKQAAEPEVAHYPTTPAQTLPGRVLQKSQGVECQNNLSQLRMLIDSYKSEDPDGKYPESLTSMPEARSILRCPINHENFDYDPETGRVSCHFPGHENF